MKLPTLAEIKALHKKYAPSTETFTVNFRHCEIVRDIALQLAETFDGPLDKDLVTSGALLHDIGYYPILNADGSVKQGHMGIEHGVIGEKILRNEKISDEIAHIASHHTGAGISLDQILERNLPLPHADYIAKTNEEKLIMYADKFHSKSDGGVFNSYGWYEQYVSKFGEESVKSFRELAQMFGKPNLSKLSKLYSQNIRDL